MVEAGRATGHTAAPLTGHAAGFAARVRACNPDPCLHLTAPGLQVKGDERVRYLTEAEIDAHLTAIAERE